MTKNIILKLKSIRYSGDSIGDDIHLEIVVKDKIYSFDKSIKPNSIKEVNKEIGQFEILDNFFEEEISIKVIEKDLIFNDTSQIKNKIKVDLGFEKSKEFEFEIKVQERQGNFRKSIAIFTVTLTLEQADRIPTVEDPEWTGNFNDDTEEMILARMIFGEAENQAQEAKIGIGFTILNRIKKHKKNWGYTVHEVILKKSQYDSFWNKNTIDKVRNPLLDNRSKLNWIESYKILLSILNQQVSDSALKSTHFHTFKNKKDFPYWATKKNFKIKLDEVYFYELKA